MFSATSPPAGGLGSGEMIYAPELAVSGVELSEIGTSWRGAGRAAPGRSHPRASIGSSHPPTPNPLP